MKIILVSLIGVMVVIGSLIANEMMSSEKEVSIYCKSTSSIGVILYADNCSDGYPFGDGGACIVLPLKEGDEIQKLSYIIDNGTENKIRFDFDTHQDTDVLVSKIEIKGANYKKTIMPRDMAELFIEINENNLSADGMLLLDNINGIQSISCLDLSSVASIFSPDIFFTLKFVVVILMIIGVTYLIYLIYSKKTTFHYNKFSQNVIMFIAAVTTTFTVLLFERKSLGSLIYNDVNSLIKIIIWNLIILWLCILVIGNCSNFKIGIFSTIVLTIFLESINYFKIILRQENFVPWDMKIAKEALDVISLSSLPWNGWIFLLVGLLVLSLVMICPLKLGDFSKNSMRNRVLTLFICSIVIMWGERQIIDNNIFSIHQFALKDSYNNNGVIISFLYFCQNMGNSIPDGYNEGAIEEIVEKILEDDREHNTDLIDEKYPNIIMVMSESFWDPQILENVEYNNGFMRRYKELAQCACYGNVLAPVYGGGTCDAEFEALTGFSMDYIQNDLMPYIGVIQNDFFSIAQYLGNKGYHTVAMHPNTGSYYRRDKVYPLLGFKEMEFGNQFEQDAVRDWFISDNAVINKIIEVYSQNRQENNEPQFIFAVTIQNHQPYGTDSVLKNEESEFTSDSLSEQMEKELEDFSAGVNASSEALGKLIDYFSSCDDPTIVIYWGDHMCNIGEKKYELAYKGGYIKENDNTDYFMYLTPMIVWDNYLGLNQVLETRSTFQILPSVLEMYNLDMPKYFEYLNDLQDYSMGISHHKVVLDATGQVYTGEDNSVKDMYRQLELLEYDYIYGERYANILFE
ncbi:MAG: sulfatase-like hydrolase/transferase [Lachnospiraceae bacterium]|nr:sulfatase-like hydrolase/transferase [Lachnospiraceae bacterium]